MAIIVGRITRIDHDMPVVIGRTRIVAPDISVGHLMKWIICSRRQRRIVGKNLADLKNASGCPTITLVFSQTRLVLTGDPTSPGQTVFSEQYRHRPSLRSPFVSALFQQIQTAMHGIPVRRESDDELRAIIRERGGMSVARN
jgi:hypothetical protein